MKIISEADVQALVNYLAKRPYEEVHRAIPMLTSLPDAPPPIPPTVQDAAATE